jgi:hypothetical protein
MNERRILRGLKPIKRDRETVTQRHLPQSLPPNTLILETRMMKPDRY